MRQIGNVSLKSFYKMGHSQDGKLVKSFCEEWSNRQSQLEWAISTHLPIYGSIQIMFYIYNGINW